MGNDKYGDINQLLSPAIEKEKAEIAPRKLRPSPAIGVMTGNTRPTATDGIRAQKIAAETALRETQEKFEHEKMELLRKLEEVNSQGNGGSPILLTMPVTKQEVTFELRSIDSNLIDVSPENERIQDFLDEISLKDILPSIRKHGQQKPGTVRPKSNGRYELIEGSRRLAAVKLAKREYLALVGDVPDADVRELSVIENKHQDVSSYEKAKAYLRQIENGEFENWTQLGAAKGISSSHISRFKACAELEELFVRILSSPSDMTLSYGETVGQLLKKDEASLKSKAHELLSLRRSAFSEGTKLLEAEDIIKQLRSAVRTKTLRPVAKRPVTYRSKDGKIYLKHTLSNKGATKLELAGFSDEQLQKILNIITSTLKVEPEKID